MINGKVTLLDESFWQDDNGTSYKPDFMKAWKNGADGVIIRAGQNAWIDEDYIDNAKNADLAKLPRGAYWFYDSRLSPKPQADIFADIVEVSGFPSLGVWGDYEENYGGNYGGEKNFKIFMDTLQERFKDKLVGVYTGPDYWITHTTFLGRPYFERFPLWIANYKVDRPLIPAPWKDYILWQFTAEGDGYAFGAESREIDMNLFNGTLDNYKRYFLLGDYQPAPPPTQGENMYNCVVKSTSTPHINLRAAADANSQDIGDMFPGETFTADSVNTKDSLGRDWIHSTKVGKVGYVLAALCTFEPVAGVAHKIEIILDGELIFTKEF